MSSSLDESAIAALEAQHGRTVTCRAAERHGDWVCVFRKPKRVEWKRFQAEQSKGTVDALENLCRTLCVHPSRDEFLALLEEHPALPVACSEAIAEVCEVEGRIDQVK
jgi:hypothetical protein